MCGGFFMLLYAISLSEDYNIHRLFESFAAELVLTRRITKEHSDWSITYENFALVVYLSKWVLLERERRLTRPNGRLIRTLQLCCRVGFDEAHNKKPPYWVVFCYGDPYENRTRVTAVKGRCLNLLTNGPLVNETLSGLVLVAEIGLEPMTYRV